MSYDAVKHRLDAGGIVILDGGTGTELERRGAPMDPGAWCGPATLESRPLLEAVHRDYIAAGAEVVTANTFASSRLMLEPAGFGDQVEEINRTAVEAALSARDSMAAEGHRGVAVGGSLSHMIPVAGGTDIANTDSAPSAQQMADAFGELAETLKRAGCEVILLEMMYHPERMPHAFRAAQETGLPVWAGFSARRGADGTVLSFARDADIPLADALAVLDDFTVDAAGVMHTGADLTGAALAEVRRRFDGPLTAYPDSGYFKMPSWQFEDVIAPEALRAHAEDWIAEGARVLGGCCGLSPEHIAALAPLGDGSAAA